MTLNLVPKKEYVPAEWKEPGNAHRGRVQQLKYRANDIGKALDSLARDVHKELDDAWYSPVPNHWHMVRHVAPLFKSAADDAYTKVIGLRELLDKVVTSVEVAAGVDISNPGVFPPDAEKNRQRLARFS